MEYKISKDILKRRYIDFKCPSCAVDLKSPLADAGSQDACPHCQNPFEVPGRDLVEREERESRAEQLRRAEEERVHQQAMKAERRREELANDADDTLRREPVPTAVAAPLSTPDLWQAWMPVVKPAPAGIPPYEGLMNTSYTLTGFALLQAVGGVISILVGISRFSDTSTASGNHDIAGASSIANNSLAGVSLISGGVAALVAAVLFFAAAHICMAVRDIAINSFRLLQKGVDHSLAKTDN